MSIGTKEGLRLMEERDLKPVLTWRNHPEVRRYMFSSAEIAWDEHVVWFTAASTNPQRHLLIWEQSGVPLGYVCLSELIAGAVADWSFHAAPEAPKGTGTQMLRAVLDYAFNEQRLHKIYAQVLQNNARSQALHCRLGFREEGYLRDQHYSEQGYQSIYCYGLLRTEWLFDTETQEEA
jgi:UDP-4-amino-4,6-dideoxy-N-acetyl-beta-L-altrosamine N-acetyltransferase